MKKAILVPIDKVESIRLKLLENNLLDKVRKIQVRIYKNENEKPIENQKFHSTHFPSENIYAEIPIINSFSNFLISNEFKNYPLINQSKPQHYINYSKSYSVKDILKNQLTENELKFVPTGWQIIGNIIIINIPYQIQNKAKLIAETIFDMYPSCKSILQNFGIKGDFRKPDRKILIGSKTETIHKEHGCYLYLP